MPLEISHKPRWTELTLNQPPRNVLDIDLLTELVSTLDELAAAQSSLLLIKANGRHFSTGYSIKEIPEEIFHRDLEVRKSSPFEKLMDRLTTYPAPILAKVQGDAYGGAVEMLACCDMRVAAEGVRLGVPSVRLGLVYSHTGLRRMIRAFGSPLVREMLMTGEAITAERASKAGFFNRLVSANDLEDSVDQIMDSMAKGAPQALRGTRRILNLLEESEVLPEESLAEIAEIRHASWSGEEFEKARDAFINKKPSPFA